MKLDHGILVALRPLSGTDEMIAARDTAGS
jgi:hypothetical protein